MKKYMLYSIASVLLLTLITAGSTFAFLSTSAQTSNNSIFSNTATLNVIYNPGETINESLSVSSSKEDGYNTTVKIKLAPNSAKAKTDLYIHINDITENIAISGFIWEVYGYRNGKQVIYTKGDFSGYNNTTNNKVSIVKDYLLSEDETSFTVYFWIDGSKTDNDVVGGTFNGYIGAISQEFTGVLGSHTVTFDANGGSVDTPSKLVQYGEAYGELPTPTREGYTFLGWNGKNLFDGLFKGSPIIEKNNNYTDTNFNDRNLNYSDLNSLFYTFAGYFIKGTYILTINSNDHWYTFNRMAIAGTDCIQVSNINIRNSYTWTQNVDGYTYFSIERDASESNYTDTAFDGYNFKLQIEEGTEATAYEPYYITSNTTVVQNKNHTLKAIWEPVS